MKSKKAIALFAVIAAVAMGTISLADISAVPLMVSSVPQYQESTGILGHVEYTLMDSDDQVKGYLQGDNAVVDAGKDCVASYMFGVDDGACSAGLSSDFNYVAIGNLTGAVTGTHSNHQTLNATNYLTTAGTDICAVDNTVDGELARKTAVVTVDTVADGKTPTDQGTVITIDTADSPFTFTTANATGSQTIHQSGIFNAHYLNPNDQNTCPTLVANSGVPDVDWNMFAKQNLNSGSGIQVTPGDSLSVKWTLTVG